MALEIQTIIDIILVTLAYCVSVLVVPNIVFHEMLREKSLTHRFIVCTVLGNVYLVNIVFLIFLLHIPGKLSLYLFTIIPLFFLWTRINRPGIRRFFQILFMSISRFFLGEAKFKTIISTLSQRPKQYVAALIRSIFSHFIHHIPEWLSLISIFAFNAWYYGYSTVTRYAYGTSDLVVHQKWINVMDQGTIFYDGIYPFGFHNVLYFLHTFFGFSTTTLLRTFNVTQMFFIYTMIYVVLKKICRSRFIPIIGVYIFSVPDLFNYMETMRYQWTLPQEFGMIFLYPCAYFLLSFFEQKKNEYREEQKYRKQNRLYCYLAQYHIQPSTISLVLFAFSFSLTLAIHFYITIIAFILCLAIAVAYFPIILYKRHLIPILISGICSLFLAIAPMGIAFVQGTPLQGTLGWALGMMSTGEESDDSVTDSTNDTQQTQDTNLSDTTDGQSTIGTSDTTSVQKSKNTPQKVTFIQKLQKVPQKVLLVLNKVKQEIKHVNFVASFLFEGCYNGKKTIPLIIYGSEILTVCAFLLLLLRSVTHIGSHVISHMIPSFYYRNVLCTGIYYIFMMLLLCADYLPLPTLMDYTRGRIFLAYATPLFITCAIDLIYVILMRPLRYHFVSEIVPIGLSIILVCLTITNNTVKPLNYIFTLQNPSEVKCNYRIMKEYPDYEYTIVTTTNSLEMIKDHARHYEMATFIKKMDHFTTTKKITIPTKYVFFYIEKKPLNYNFFGPLKNGMNNLGYISRDAAAKQPNYKGIYIYFEENRYILESRFFYWAKAFEQKYPQEFQVYYEDDGFICYRVVQNEAQLYNFAIDYGYNK